MLWTLMEKCPLNSRVYVNIKYVIYMIFIGMHGESVCSIGTLKVLPRKAIGLLSSFWLLLQVFLEICLTLSHHVYCLVSHLLKKQVRSQWVLFKLYDCHRMYDSQDSCVKWLVLYMDNIQNVILWLRFYWSCPLHPQIGSLLALSFPSEGT